MCNRIAHAVGYRAIKRTRTVRTVRTHSGSQSAAGVSSSTCSSSRGATFLPASSRVAAGAAGASSLGLPPCTPGLFPSRLLRGPPTGALGSAAFPRISDPWALPPPSSSLTSKETVPVLPLRVVPWHLCPTAALPWRGTLLGPPQRSGKRRKCGPTSTSSRRGSTGGAKRSAALEVWTRPQPRPQVLQLTRNQGSESFLVCCLLWRLASPCSGKRKIKETDIPQGQLVPNVHSYEQPKINRQKADRCNLPLTKL